MSQQDVQQVTAINDQIAALFEEIAERLSQRRQNDFRVPIYLGGAATLRELFAPVDWLLQQEGQAGLANLPGLGQTLARCIAQYVSVGRINVLEQLRGNAIVPWSCPRRTVSLEASLKESRRKAAAPPVPRSTVKRPVNWPINRITQTGTPLVQRSAQRGRTSESKQLINELLSVDAEYRREVVVGRLPKIAPKRFNPDGVAWLPILHTQRFGRHYTALYSNTAHAHEAGAVGDWVIVHRDDQTAPGQWTIITSQFGPLAGHRLVLGNQDECLVFYEQHPGGADPDDGRNEAAASENGSALCRVQQLDLFNRS
jgi:hypothetical protein